MNTTRPLFTGISFAFSDHHKEADRQDFPPVAASLLLIYPSQPMWLSPCSKSATGAQRNVCLSNHGSGQVWQECHSIWRPGGPAGAFHSPGGRPQQHDALRRPYCLQTPHYPRTALLWISAPRNEGVHTWVQRWGLLSFQNAVTHLKYQPSHFPAATDVLQCHFISCF